MTVKKEIVTKKNVSCEGEAGALGHPKVYLKIGESGTKECPYCGKVFELKASKNK